MKLKNWAGNYEYSTSQVHYPTTLEQIQLFVEQHKKIKVIGTRHSFNGIADSTENLISLERYQPTININHENSAVSLTANVTYAQLCHVLQAERYALHNLASLPHISVVGACSTATHGSGDANQNLAAAVSGLEIVIGSGELIKLTRQHEWFEGAVVNLGALGVVVKITLDLLPAFEMRQEVYENLPMQHLEAHFDEIMASAYSVSLFTDWQQNSINQVWLKQRYGEYIFQLPNFFGATPATIPKHPIANFSADTCTEQLGIRGVWHERLPHFRSDSVPSAGNELQSEYFVPRFHAVEAIRAIKSLRDKIAPHLLISEIRSIAADKLWMSPCYQQNSIAIHFTWKPNWVEVSKLLPIIEAQLAPFNARPHWGKLFTMPGHHLQSLYEKLSQFQRMVQQYDPHGKFRNFFLETILLGNP